MDVTNYRDVSEVSCVHWKTYGYRMRTMHAHNEYEIHFSKCDGNTFFVDDKAYPSNKDNIFISNSTDLHKINVPDDVLYERYIISFKPQVARELSSEGLDLLEFFDRRPSFVSPRLVLGQSSSAICTELADKLFDLCSHDSGYGNLLMRRFVLGELLIVLNRLFMDKIREGHDFDNALHLSQYRMSNVTEYIDRHYSDEIRLDDIAEVCHLNKAYLCRLFKKNTGICITDYITYRRLSQAASRLRAGESVADTARSCGFNSDAYFITSFKRVFGCTPRQYARQSNGGEFSHFLQEHYRRLSFPTYYSYSLLIHSYAR